MRFRAFGSAYAAHLRNLDNLQVFTDFQGSKVHLAWYICPTKLCIVLHPILS